ncbi:Abi family protein [Herbiconiux liukaitaii]|uniref:Abi family protein n=1 Tax=Herbiconiux liukaitaii TaxID=3342799 RepID=UPI0035B7EE31
MSGTERIRFEKPARTVEDQARSLIADGLVASAADVAALLQRMSYYRFSGYAWPFRNEATGRFLAGTSVGDIATVIAFDEQLRQIVWPAIEVVEVRLRRAFADETSLVIGPMGYADAAHAHSPAAHARDLRKLAEALAESDEAFVAHFFDRYSDPVPPVWMATEVMTLGLLSRWYDNLGSDSLRKSIAGHFALPMPVLRSYLRQLTVIRNICAHHSRLWNRRLSVTIKDILGKPVELAEATAGSDPHRIFRWLSITVYILDRIRPGHSYKDDLRAHLLANWELAIQMDVPNGFENDALWR